MRIPQEARMQFYNEYRNKQFTLEDVMSFVAPYFEYDVEKAVKSALKNFARSFITSFKDSKNVRECFAYGSKNNIYYSFLSNKKLGFEAKKDMLHNIQAKKAGLIKAERKIKKINVLENQISFLDATNQ